MFINLVLKSKIKYILILVLAILVTLILTVLFKYLNLDNKINVSKGKFDINDVKVEKYYTYFDMTVISNKNIHTYSVFESYNKLENETVLKYFDYMKNEVVVKLKDNTCTITNNGNMLGVTLQITDNNKNITSFSTFMYLYNLIDGSCGCNKKTYEKDDKATLVLDICNKDNCIIKKIFNTNYIYKLELTLKKGIPETFVIYDKNKKEYISIVYSMFKFNEFKE